MANYDGLTRNTWPGTWSPTGNHPIVLDTEVRGALRFISGEVGDRLTDIPGQRLQEGMLVYVKTGYDSVVGGEYYKYSLLEGESRNASTGEMPNAAGNWTRTFVASVDAANVTVSPSGSITATDVQGAIVELANQQFSQENAPTGPNIEEGALWYQTTTENLYVYREVSQNVFNWLPLIIGSDDNSDTLDGGLY